jgi:hypothetical protein
MQLIARPRPRRSAPVTVTRRRVAAHAPSTHSPRATDACSRVKVARAGPAAFRVSGKSSAAAPASSRVAATTRAPSRVCGGVRQIRRSTCACWPRKACSSAVRATRPDAGQVSGCARSRAHLLPPLGTNNAPSVDKPVPGTVLPAHPISAVKLSRGQPAAAASQHRVGRVVQPILSLRILPTSCPGDPGANVQLGRRQPDDVSMARTARAKLPGPSVTARPRARSYRAPSCRASR